jgi:hypothetical protein
MTASNHLVILFVVLTVPGKKSPPSRASSNGDFFHQCEREQRDESSAAEESPSSAPKPTEAVSSKQQSTQANGHSEATPLHDRNGQSEYNSSKGLLEGEASGVEEGRGLERKRELRRWQTQPAMRCPQEETAAKEDSEKAEVSPSKGAQPKAQKAKKKKGGRQKPGGEGGVDSTGSMEDADDWEAAAEALGVVVPETGESEIGGASENGSHSHIAGDESGASTTSEGVSPKARNGYVTRRLVPELPDSNARNHRSGGSAWRQDDSHRPGTLPRLEKYSSFPIEHHHTGSMWEATISRTIWGSPATPATCPICTEELDLTDTSFVPCPCGFRLCLFCHHRIALDDGRCPGCRKAYQSEVKVEKHVLVPRSHLVRLKV